MKRLVAGLLLAVCIIAVVFAAQGVSNGLSPSDETNKIDNSSQEQAAAATDHAEDAFESDLPILSISTHGQQIEKETEIVAELSVIDNESGTNWSDGAATLTSDIAIKYRGNSSYLTFDKLSYRITLLNDGEKGVDSSKREEGLLGMASDSGWVLNGPFLDRSLVRNTLMYGLARDLMNWAPDTRYCEVFLDGAYQGVYVLIEPIRNSVNRLGLTQFGLISGETAYVLKRDREGTETNVIETYGNLNGYTHQEMSIAHPNETAITEAQRSWIESDLSKFERTLYGDAFADPNVGYAAYIDVDEFIDYFLLNEFSMISDASYLSTYVYKDIGGKLKLVVWDFNNGFDNYPWAIKRTDEFHVANNNWFDRLLEDRAFLDAVCARWKELRAGMLSDDAIVERVEGEYASIGEDAIARNTEAWEYTYHERLFTSLNEDGSYRAEPSSPDEARSMLETTALTRAAWMDDHLADLYSRCVN